MKKMEAMEKFAAGQPVLLVEFRNSKAEQITWRDKLTRATLTAPMLRHSCEAVDGTPYIVSERVDDKFVVADFKPKFKKGDKCILTFKTMTTEKGIIHFGGSLELVEPDGVAGSALVPPSR